jgi:hypothetical protein
MESIIKDLNNRELAIVTWIIIGIISFLFIKAFRKFIADISKIIFSKSFIVIYLLLFGYLCLVLLELNRIKFWDYSLFTDTLFWLIGAGIILVMNSISKDSNYFKKIALNSIKITILIEFIINLHVFSYITELVILPILILLGIFKAIAESEKKLDSVSNFLNYLIRISGMIVLTFAIYKTIQNFRLDFTFKNLQKLLLPSILTILFIPFSYLLAVFTAYESLFVLLINLKNERWTKSRIKLEIVKNAKLSLSRISIIRSGLNLYEISETENLKQYIRSIKKPVANTV